MTRGRTLAQTTADTAAHAGSVALLELLFDSGALRLALGPWSIVVDGNTYIPTGPLLSVDANTESADGTEGLSFTMSGLASGVFDLVVSEPYSGRLVRLLEQRYDAADQPVGTATVEYIGRMKLMTSTEEPESGKHTVTVQTEQFDADGRRPRPLRYSDAEQRRRYPLDKGAEYATAMTEVVLQRKPKT